MAKILYTIVLREVRRWSSPSELTPLFGACRAGIPRLFCKKWVGLETNHVLYTPTSSSSSKRGTESGRGKYFQHGSRCAHVRSAPRARPFCARVVPVDRSLYRVCTGARARDRANDRPPAPKLPRQGSLPLAQNACPKKFSTVHAKTKRVNTEQDCRLGMDQILQ